MGLGFRAYAIFLFFFFGGGGVLIIVPKTLFYFLRPRYYVRDCAPVPEICRILGLYLQGFL